MNYRIIFYFILMNFILSCAHNVAPQNLLPNVDGWAEKKS